MSEDSITMKFRVYEVDNELNILLDSVIKLTNEFYMEKTGRCVENNFTFRCVDSRRFFAMIWPLILTAFGNIFM